jgi:hypothetical protein
MPTSRFSVLLSTSVPLLLPPTGWTFQFDVGRRLTPIHRRSQRLITLLVINHLEGAHSTGSLHIVLLRN